MRILFLSLLLVSYNVFGQSLLNNPRLKKQVLQFPFEENQYFDLTGGEFLFMIIKEESELTTPDSLVTNSRKDYNALFRYIGSEIKEVPVGIAYIGKQSDRHNIVFHYKNYQYLGSSPLPPYPGETLDTAIAEVPQMDGLGGNKYIRANGNRIGFYVVVNEYDRDSLWNRTERAYTTFIVRNLGEGFRRWNMMELTYIDRFGYNMPMHFRVSIDNVIISQLGNYLNNTRKIK